MSSATYISTPASLLLILTSTKYHHHCITGILPIETPPCCLPIAGVTWTPFILPIINQNLHLDFCCPAPKPKAFTLCFLCRIEAASNLSQGSVSSLNITEKFFYLLIPAQSVSNKCQCTHPAPTWANQPTEVIKIFRFSDFVGLFFKLRNVI